jgi:hypothetical protein
MCCAEAQAEAFSFEKREDTELSGFSSKTTFGEKLWVHLQSRVRICLTLWWAENSVGPALVAQSKIFGACSLPTLWEHEEKGAGR